MTVTLTTLLQNAPIESQSSTFTSSGSFTVPDNVYTLFVTIVAGGGGREVISTGYSNVYLAAHGSGGQGGYYIDYPISVTPGQILTVTVGAGGTSRYYYYYTTTVDVGTSSAGGASEIKDGATSLIKVWGGAGGKSFFTSNSTGFNGNLLSGGAGGYPNGTGGGARNYMVQANYYSLVWGGACGINGKNTANIQGGGHHCGADNNSATWGMGRHNSQFGIKGIEGPINGLTNGGSAPAANLTDDAGTLVESATYSQATQTPGYPGIVILRWFKGNN